VELGRDAWLQFADLDRGFAREAARRDRGRLGRFEARSARGQLEDDSAARLGLLELLAARRC
jgi:hypothetical protein